MSAYHNYSMPHSTNSKWFNAYYRKPGLPYLRYLHAILPCLFMFNVYFMFAFYYYDNIIHNLPITLCVPDVPRRFSKYEITALRQKWRRKRKSVFKGTTIFSRQSYFTHYWPLLPHCCIIVWVVINYWAIKIIVY